MKKLMLWILVLVLAIATASATSLENLPQAKYYWTFDDSDATSTLVNDSYADFSVPGSMTYGLTGVLGLSANTSSGTPDIENTTMIGMETVRAIDLWFKHPTTDPGDRAIISVSKDASNFRYCAIAASGKLRCGGPGEGGVEITSAGTVPLSQYNHLVLSLGSDGFRMWLNNVEVGNNTGHTANFSSDWDRVCIGYECGSSSMNNVLGIDNVAFLYSQMNGTSVNASYNGGAGFNYSDVTPPPPAPPSLPIFNVSNIVNLTGLNTFNITITNSSYSEQFNLSNSSIQVNLSAGLYNITVNSLEHFDFFSEDYNVTTTDTHNFLVGQGKVTINLTKIITRTQMINFTALNQNVSVNSTETGGSDQLDLFVNTGQTQLRIDGFNFTGGSFNYTLSSPVTNTSHSFNVTDTQFVFLARDSFTGDEIENFTLTLINSTYSFQNTYVLTSRNLTLQLENVSFVSNVTRSGYVDINHSFEATSNNTEVAFAMVKALTVNGSILHEQSRDPILNNTNFTIQIIGTTYSHNLTVKGNSSQNTTFRVDDVPAGSYEILYFGDGFHQRSKFITITDQTNVQTDFFLLDNTNGTAVTFNINDEGGRELENATVKALRYYVDLGGTATGFIEVEACKTNFVGQCQMHLEQFDVFYKFVIDYAGSTLLTTSPTEIIGDSFSFQVNTIPSVIQEIISLNNVSATLNFTNSSSPNFFTYTYSAQDGLLRTSCLKISRLDAFGKALLNETCVTTSSGSIAISINESDEAVYIAEAFVGTTSNNQWPIITLDINLVQDFKNFGIQGVFYTMLFIGVMGGVVLFSPSLTILLALVALAASVATGLVYMGVGSLIFLLIAGGILYFKMRL